MASQYKKTPWTEMEDSWLDRMMTDGNTLTYISHILQRSMQDIAQRAAMRDVSRIKSGSPYQSRQQITLH